LGAAGAGFGKSDDGSGGAGCGDDDGDANVESVNAALLAGSNRGSGRAGAGDAGRLRDGTGSGAYGMLRLILLVEILRAGGLLGLAGRLAGQRGRLGQSRFRLTKGNGGGRGGGLCVRDRRVRKLRRRSLLLLRWSGRERERRRKQYTNAEGDHPAARESLEDAVHGKGSFLFARRWPRYPGSGRVFLRDVLTEWDMRRDDMRPAMEALNRFPDGGEDVEEAIDAGPFQIGARLRRDAGETNIAVALHCFLKRAEEEMHGGLVHFAQVRAVNDDGGAHNVQFALQLPEEETLLLPVKLFRELPDGNRFGSKDHSFAT
jgi:hypothetical protein